MKRRTIIGCCLLVASAALFSCNNDSKTPTENNTTATGDTARTFSLKEDNVTYTANGVTMHGYVAYDENKTGARPAVLVVPEWWGLTEYPKKRARQLAELGYIAMAIDMYGNGKLAETPDSAQAYSTPFYKDPTMGKQRFDAGLAKLKTYSQADSTRMAAIGYCFGGTQALNAALLGDNLKAIVSFHGGLDTAPVNKDLLKGEILICHGEADSFVPADQVDAFRKSMEKIGAKYTFKTYPTATHAFTNPDADESARKFKMPIAYNAAADTASWNDMKQFFERVLK